jgi:hypothetical protein
VYIFISMKLPAVLTPKQKSKPSLYFSLSRVSEAASIFCLQIKTQIKTLSISFSSDQNPDRVSAAACLRRAKGKLLSLSPSFSSRSPVSRFVDIPPPFPLLVSDMDMGEAESEDFCLIVIDFVCMFEGFPLRF